LRESERAAAERAAREGRAAERGARHAASLVRAQAATVVGLRKFANPVDP
jgi:hypothetical protein